MRGIIEKTALPGHYGRMTNGFEGLLDASKISHAIVNNRNHLGAYVRRRMRADQAD
jgi:hypothetical protein